MARAQLQGFSMYLNWDFGVVTMQGIPTNVTLLDVVAAGETICVPAGPYCMMPVLLVVHADRPACGRRQQLQPAFFHTGRPGAI
jgi:hypothetical protein